MDNTQTACTYMPSVLFSSIQALEEGWNFPFRLHSEPENQTKKVTKICATTTRTNMPKGYTVA